MVGAGSSTTTGIGRAAAAAAQRRALQITQLLLLPLVCSPLGSWADPSMSMNTDENAPPKGCCCDPKPPNAIFVLDQFREETAAAALCLASAASCSHDPMSGAPSLAQ